MDFDMRMLAYCGIYCEQCSCRAAVAEQDFKHLEPFPEKFKEGRSSLSDYACEGCKGRNICGPCTIKDCALDKGINSCAECGLFPCETLIQFGNDGVPHHQWALENLRSIRENGVDAWFENLRPALRCQCGKRQSWYCVCPEHGSADEGNCMEKVNLARTANALHELYVYKKIGMLNGNALSVVNVENRTLDFHVHEHSDELFYVIEGTFRLETEEGNFDVAEGELIIVPKGVRHRPVVTTLSRFLMVELEGTLNKENSGDLYEV